MTQSDDIDARPLSQGDVNQNPDTISYWSLVYEDLTTHHNDLFAQGFWALFNHRFGNWRMGLTPKTLRAPMSFLYRIWHKVVQITTGIDIPYTTQIGRRVRLEHFGGMILIARSIGDDVTIRQNTTFGVRTKDNPTGHPTIGDRADIGVGVVVLGEVKIGADAVVGANAVVLSDVPDGAVAVGVPARIIKEGADA